MAIIKIGKIFMAKFGTREEPKVDVALGGLPVTFSIIRPFRQISPADKYKISLQTNEEQNTEIKAAMMEALQALNEAGAYGATKKQLQEVLDRAVGESTLEEGKFRFYGSRPMGFKDSETGEMQPFTVSCYNGTFSEENLVEGGVSLGAGSVVRSVFTLSLFKGKDGKQVLLNINPKTVIVLKKVEPPKRESISHDGLDDTDAYDF